MSADPKFIHLRVHTEYSLLEGAVPVKKLAGICEKNAMPAVAITDTNNMFAALEASEILSKTGVQPIIGCQLDVGLDPPESGGRGPDAAPMVFLAQNEHGYQNLMKLNSCAYLGANGQLPQINLVDIETHHQGLICLTGGPKGPMGYLLQAAQRPRADALLQRLKAVLSDRLYMELQRHPGEDGQPEAERMTERGFIELAYAHDVPLVATNDVYFPDTEFFEAHDALICIAEGAYVDQQEPRRRLTAQHYFNPSRKW